MVEGTLQARGGRRGHLGGQGREHGEDLRPLGQVFQDAEHLLWGGGFVYVCVCVCVCLCSLFFWGGGLGGCRKTVVGGWWMERERGALCAATGEGRHASAAKRGSTDCCVVYGPWGPQRSIGPARSSAPPSP